MVHHFFPRIISLNPRAQIQKSLVQMALIPFTALTIKSRLPPMKATIQYGVVELAFQSMQATAITPFIVPDQMDQFILETEKILFTIMGITRGSIPALEMTQYGVMGIVFQSMLAMAMILYIIGAIIQSSMEQMATIIYGMITPNPQRSMAALEMIPYIAREIIQALTEALVMIQLITGAIVFQSMQATVMIQYP